MTNTLADSLLDLSDATLDAALTAAGDGFVLLDLWAPWCKPCLAMAPVLDQVVAAAGANLRLAKVDVERYPDVLTRFGARGIPTLLLLKDGAELGRLVGARPASELKAWLARQGVEAPTSTALDDDGPTWGAFYGDEGLRAFLLGRVQSLAAEGGLQRARFPSWANGQGSVSAALVRHADPRVFERVSGLPFSLACGLEFAGLGTPAEVDEVLRAIVAGADLRHVAWDLMRWWLSDAANGWAEALAEPPVDALRVRWLQLSQGPRRNDAAAWAELRLEAGRHLGPPDPQRELARQFAQLIEELSPPPAPDDAQGWVGAFLMRAGFSKYALTMHGQGWTRQDLAMEGEQLRWFDERAAREPHGRFSDERLAAARDEWQRDHEQPAYRAKVAERDARWPEWQAAMHGRIRAELARLVGAASHIG